MSKLPEYITALHQDSLRDLKYPPEYLSTDELDIFIDLLFAKDIDETNFVIALSMLPHLEYSERMKLMDFASKQCFLHCMREIADSPMSSKIYEHKLKLKMVKFSLRDNHIKFANEIISRILEEDIQIMNNFNFTLGEICHWCNLYVEMLNRNRIPSSEPFTLETIIDEKFFQNLIKSKSLIKVANSIKNEIRKNIGSEIFFTVRKLGSYAVLYDNTNIIQFLDDKFRDLYPEQMDHFYDGMVILASTINSVKMVEFMETRYSYMVGYNAKETIMNIHSGNFDEFKNQTNMDFLPPYIKSNIIEVAMQTDDIRFITYLNKPLFALNVFVPQIIQHSKMKISFPVLKYLMAEIGNSMDEDTISAILSKLVDDTEFIQYINYFRSINHLTNDEIIEILFEYILNRPSSKQNISTIEYLLSLCDESDTIHIDYLLSRMSLIKYTSNRNPATIRYLIHRFEGLKVPDDLLEAILKYDSNQTLYDELMQNNTK